MMKMILLFLLGAFISACGSVQTGAVSRAYEKYEEKDYERAIELITFAQNVDDPSSELHAELSYLKALSYEQLGQREKADNLFRHIAKNYESTEYGSLARKYENVGGDQIK